MSLSRKLSTCRHPIFISLPGAHYLVVLLTLSLAASSRGPLGFDERF